MLCCVLSCGSNMSKRMQPHLCLHGALKQISPDNLSRMILNLSHYTFVVQCVYTYINKQLKIQIDRNSYKYNYTFEMVSLILCCFEDRYFIQLNRRFPARSRIVIDRSWNNLWNLTSIELILTCKSYILKFVHLA